MPDLREVEAGTTVITAVAVSDIVDAPEEGIPLVTQSLMGWPVQVMGVEGDWLHIQAYDGSPGWAKVEHFCLPQGLQDNTHVQIYRATTEVTPQPNEYCQPICNLFLGSRLILLAEEQDFLKVALPQGGSAYLQKEKARVLPVRRLPKPSDILAVGAMFGGAPYLWGGMTIRGVDCSGLTYMAYLLNGYQLPRNAQDQYRYGKPVEKTDLIMGDLVFFSTIDPGPSHVGIYQGDGLFLNARTKEGVTVTSFEDAFFATRYLGARRYLLNNQEIIS